MQRNLSKRAEVSPDYSQKKYQDLYSLSPVPYLTLDKNGKIIDINNACETFLGIHHDDLLNKIFLRYVITEYHQIYLQYIHGVLSGIAERPCKVKLLRKHKLPLRVHMDSTLLVNHENKNNEILISIYGFYDSDNMNHAASLFTRENPNPDIETSSILVHEISQPIGALDNYLYGCINRIEKNNFDINEILYILKQSATQSHRIIEILMHVKNYTMKGNLNLESISIPTLIHEAIDFIRNEFTGFSINIKYNPSPDIPNIFLDNIYIQQTIIHLARNAIEAMLEAKTPDPKLTIYTNSGGKNAIEVIISDNGPGIDKNTMKKLFMPNFTTKSYGIGIGLILCRAIIEAHGGNIKIEANPAGGISVSFILELTGKS